MVKSCKSQKALYYEWDSPWIGRSSDIHIVGSDFHGGGGGTRGAPLYLGGGGACHQYM